MRVLVTGGSGFIGSHVVDRLLAAGVIPRILDLVPSPYHSPHDVETILGSVTDPAAIDRATDDCDALIHLAAVADVGQVHASPGHAEETNAGGTLAVLEGVRRAGLGRLVYGSTIWVYSDCPERVVDEEAPIPSPRHLYTATKLAGEHYCSSYAELYGVPCTILRFGIPYGPRARDGAVVPNFARAALAREPLEIAGSGRQSRQFVYVEDLAEGVVAALKPAAANRVYNLAGNESVTVLEVAEAVCDVLGEGRIVHSEARGQDFPSKYVSSKRARAELGWEPKIAFGAGVGRYVEWLRAQPQRNPDERRPAAPEAPVASPSRVLILTADIGEGHDAPARALAAELSAERPGVQVSVVDCLAAIGGLVQRLVRDGSWFMFRRAPWLFEVQYFFLARLAPTRWLFRRLGYLLTGRRLLRLIRAHNPDAVLSTYPGATEVLGELRRRRRLDVPAFSAITDLAGLFYWAHPGIDLHFVIHEESIEEVERIAGPGSARWARPPTSSDFLRQRSQAEARRALRLPQEGKIVVISGGGWGVGDLAGAIDAALQTDAVMAICIAGRNEALGRRLRKRYGAEPRLRMIGFTDRMGDLLAAADVLVHSTAGLTVLEAQIRGCLVISYGFGVGHIRVNNRAYERFGLAQTARSREELGRALRRALAERREPDPAFARLPSPASLVLEARQRSQPLPSWRLRLARFATATATVLVILGWGLSTNDPYSVVSTVLDLHPTTAVATSRPQVGVLVEAAPALVPRVAADMSRLHLQASFALPEDAPAATINDVRRAGEDPIPLLNGGAPIGWLKTRGELKRSAQTLGLKGPLLYAVPNHAFTLGQYALAKTAGASPVSGAFDYTPGEDPELLRPGEIVEINLGSGSDFARVLDPLSTQLRQRGLRAVSISDLMRADNADDG
jgi:nucleoside-diphosphate-sugar epimerase/UDP-N-acetylglucosamine:LPS N-acetylglucosamine transferase